MTTLPTSPTAGVKRTRQLSHDSSPTLDEHHGNKPSSPQQVANGSSASSFRNVSACNRCRLRKNRCDQQLPACTACQKAHVKCVGYDPISKREIPRSYVYFLETRVSYLESLLQSNGVPFDPPEEFASTQEIKRTTSDLNGDAHTRTAADAAVGEDAHEGRNKVDRLLSHASRVAVQGASDSRFLGSTSGISFARVVFAAVKSSVNGAASERGMIKPSKPHSGTAGGTSMRDSFFGLHTKPSIQPATFPARDVGLSLVELYFEHANPQIPILHRPDFMAMFDKVYATEEHNRTARELYMLNIVFAIGAAIIVGKSNDEEGQASSASASRPEPESHSFKRRRLSDDQAQPEEYHASAIVHLESFLSSSAVPERLDGIGGSLEELQAVLLLAGFALLRPVAPGLWYIVGVAVRLAVDLGLHSEDWADNDIRNVSEDHRNPEGDLIAEPPTTEKQLIERGRRQYICDFRRRLWWCVYSFDRLVSTCVGRPFGITDQVITTEFPTLLDDNYITPRGFTRSPASVPKPTYKLVAYHYFRLRLLQSEILQVLQHRQALQARERGVNRDNPFIHKQLPSPFLRDFGGSFRIWRQDIDRRLWEWKTSSPTQEETGVQFSPLFLELNYWQAVIMLYRQSLSVPPVLAEELASTNEEIQSPSMVQQEDQEDEEAVFLKVAEAGQKVLKLYRQLHRIHLVNYTFLATHHLFMAGISFLYAIWHSPTVRSQLSLDDVDFTVLAATSVLDDLIEKCPPAEACRDAFVRMSKATIKMCLSTTGFGNRGGLNNMPNHMGSTETATVHSSTQSVNPNAPYFTHRASAPVASQRRQPEFDYDLRKLFSDEESASRPFVRYNNMPKISPAQRQSLSIPQQMPILKAESSNSSLSPQQTPAFPGPRTSSTLTSPIMSTQMPQNSHGYPQQQSSPTSFGNAMSNSNTYSSFANQYPGLSPFSDLDFLETFPLGPEKQSSTDQVQPFDSAFADFNMDFGMGWDGSLPAGGFGDESGGVDLFDGFFFGGQQG
ncbi:uncharacterized protein PV09_01829 [Verruconis gallopava]|uniref:Zn(2)-C6 fungal-type domain-containing protein n=1 Tax=Verruconis gallopava TaxID=253628 RepID=A0A0D2AN26_9PEZI|nr:uncharacterized protein PV09_01829 [Verruconis gallopava]KIW07920.1 hypothetical protein PV09_01829 [Verruconis gallopava]